MSKITEFRFRWEDAWGLIDLGYDTTIETSDSGKFVIYFLVNKKPYLLDFSNREDEMIADMEQFTHWNQKKYYNYDMFDGTRWILQFIYENKAIMTGGMNGYPSDFLTFLNLLHQKYNVPKAAFENEECIKRDIRYTEIEDLRPLG